MHPISVQAHRGSPDPAAGIRENTLAAFARARRLGADGVELDVRRTADGGLAIHHDPVIEGRGAIHEISTDELPPDVPLLGDALDECRGMTVNIEVKNLPGEPGFDPDERCAKAVGEQIDRASPQARVVVSSFWPGSLEALREAHPEIPTGLLLARSFGAEGMVTAATRIGCRSLHPHVDLVDAELVEKAHRAGVSVAVWTVNDRALLETVSRAGVDTVITDEVPLVLQVLSSR